MASPTVIHSDSMIFHPEQSIETPSGSNSDENCRTSNLRRNSKENNGVWDSFPPVARRSARRRQIFARISSYVHILRNQSTQTHRIDFSGRKLGDRSNSINRTEGAEFQILFHKTVIFSDRTKLFPMVFELISHPFRTMVCPQRPSHIAVRVHKVFFLNSSCLRLRISGLGIY